MYIHKSITHLLQLLKHQASVVNVID